jgi:amino acid transporter
MVDMSHLDYLPSVAEQTNLHRNYWTGFWLILIVGTVLFVLLMWIIGLIMKKDILDVLFGTQGNKSDRAVAYAIGGIALGALVLLCVLYLYRSGSFRAVGADAYPMGREQTRLFSDEDNYILKGKRS